MSCKDTQELLDGYLDGELDIVRGMEIEGHLRRCPACSQVYENHQALRSAIRARAPYFKAPAGLHQRVRSTVRQASKAEPASRVVTWRAPWRPAWNLLGLAAALVIAVLTWSISARLWSPSADELLAQEVLSSHVRSLMANHLTDVPSSDQHTVKPWFNGKLDFSPPVKDLTNEGFPLVGGRLDYVANRPVAALVYQRQKHFINLFIWPASQGPGIAEKTVTRQGYNLLHWTQSGMTYWVVSDLNRGELQQFVQLVRSSAPLPTSP